MNTSNLNSFGFTAYLAASALLALALSACAAEPVTSLDVDDIEGRSAMLYGEFPDGRRLPVVPRSEWTQAREGCDGLLADTERFARAEGEDTLLVALDRDGIVCVDSVASIDTELGDALPERIYNSLLDYPGPADDPFVVAPPSMPEGEPSPQPNEPNPQPNDPPPDEGEPSPQPNDPGDDD